jgi:hypothetical protein
MAMKNTETESYKRLMSLGRVAGPDDPIYSSGLTVSYVQRPTPSTSGSPPSTDGATKESSSSAQDEIEMGVQLLEERLGVEVDRDDPMLPAMGQMELALQRLMEKKALDQE